MSKQMNEQELLTHCNDAVDELRETLEEFSKSKTAKIKKRAMLIAYWLRTYIRYLRTEDSFSPESVFRLKRGAIVRVEFGYRVGRELGGRHYAVVLDVNNSVHRNTVTVVPLGSIKEHSDSDRYSVVLDEGIYIPIHKKLMALIDDAKQIVSEANEMKPEIEAAPAEKKAVLKAVQRQKIGTGEKLIAQLNAWIEEISHMKLGSAAKIDQITTISKMRISQPLQKTHPLYGIRLSPDDMNKIDEKLLEFYFPEASKRV